MSHTADVAQVHDSHAVGVGRTEKEDAHVPSGGGAKSLWVMGVLMTLKVPGHWTGGAYALFEVAPDLAQDRRRTYTTARTRLST